MDTRMGIALLALLWAGCALDAGPPSARPPAGTAATPPAVPTVAAPAAPAPAPPARPAVAEPTQRPAPAPSAVPSAAASSRPAEIGGLVGRLQRRCTAHAAICSTWAQFRQASPWPYQAIGARRTATNEFVVVVSEPPPTASRAELTELAQAVFGQALLDTARLRYPTGIDGWLEDLVLRVRIDERAAPLRVMSGHDLQPWALPAPLVQRLQWLHRALQLTPEGFYVDDLAAVASGTGRPTIPSVTITAKDVNAWLTPAREWTTLDSRAARKLRWAQVEQLRAPQALHASEGLVALVIPAGSTREQLAAALRQYGIASDLTVAAVQPRRSALTVLLGRARQLPLTLLPPLRLEAVSALMQARGQEMGQSYERGRIFAGKVDAGMLRGWDWAPIYLSQPLEDSEFGTLLNLADQVLKSWSERGEIEYFAFDYARPARFPFAQRRASEFFTERLQSRSLTFNWNTTGYTTLVEMPVGQVLTADRSAALPITYLPGDGSPERRTDPAAVRVARDGADTARVYFDRLGDPLLVRVAQHVLLFHAFGAMQTGGSTAAPAAPAAPADPPRGRTDVASEALKQQAQQWLASPGLVQSLAPDVAAELATLRRRVGMNDAEVADLLANPHGRRASQQQEQLQRELATLNAGIQSVNELAQRSRVLFEKMCADLNGTIVPIVEPGKSGRRCTYREPTSIPPSMKAYEEASQAYDVLKAAVLRHEEDYGQQEAAFRRYVERVDSARRVALKVAGRAGETWEEGRVLAAVLERAATVAAPGSIRTPSVVLSFDAIDFFSVGGHNIGASPMRVQLDGAAARPGLRRVGDASVLTMSSEHLGASGDIARRGLDAVGPAAQRPAQTVPTALHLEPKAGGGLAPPPPPPTSALRAAAEPAPGGRKLTDGEVMRRFADEDCTVCVLRESDLGRYVLDKGPPSAVHFVTDPTLLPEVISAARNRKLTAFHGEQSAESGVLMAAGVRAADVQALARASPIRRSIESAKAYFADARPGDPPTVTLVLSDAGGSKRHFVVHGGKAQATRTLFSRRVSPRDAQVLDAPDAGVAWLRELGAFAERFGAAPPVTEVRFPARGAAPRIEVRVVTRAGVAVGVQTSTVRQALARAPQQADLATVLVGVRAELKARLNPTDWLFQIDTVGGDLRVAEADPDRRR